MNDYLLDTNIVTAYINGDEAVVVKMETYQESGIFLCPPVYYEAMRGLHMAEGHDQNSAAGNLTLSPGLVSTHRRGLGSGAAFVD